MLTRQFLLEDFLLTVNFGKPLSFWEFASGYFEPCNPGRPALRKWWHTTLERFRVFFCFWEEDLSFSVPVRHSKSNLLNTTTLSTLSVTTKRNWPFPSSKNSHFRNETKCKTFLVKMKFTCMRIKNHFHINGFTLTLALKQRLEATWKWPTEDKNLKIVKITLGACFQTETAVFIIYKDGQYLRLLFNWHSNLHEGTFPPVCSSKFWCPFMSLQNKNTNTITHNVVNHTQIRKYAVKKALKLNYFQPWV